MALGLSSVLPSDVSTATNARQNHQKKATNCPEDSKRGRGRGRKGKRESGRERERERASEPNHTCEVPERKRKKGGCEVILEGRAP